jgi:hypothetical protein
MEQVGRRVHYAISLFESIGPDTLFIGHSLVVLLVAKQSLLSLKRHQPNKQEVNCRNCQRHYIQWSC